jgi:hypothetical protein
MLYRMHLILSADQRTKLEALRAGGQAARIANRSPVSVVIPNRPFTAFIESTSLHLEAFVRKTPTFWASAVAVALAFRVAQEPAKGTTSRH